MERRKQKAESTQSMTLSDEDARFPNKRKEGEVTNALVNENDLDSESDEEGAGYNNAPVQKVCYVFTQWTLTLLSFPHRLTQKHEPPFETCVFEKIPQNFFELSIWIPAITIQRQGPWGKTQTKRAIFQSDYIPEMTWSLEKFKRTLGKRIRFLSFVSFFSVTINSVRKRSRS